MIEDIISSVVSNIASHSFINFFERKSKLPKNNNLTNTPKLHIEGNLIKHCTTAISIQGNCNNLSITDNTSIGCDKLLDINGQNHQDINIQNNKFIR
jgi:hypothetical protein